MIFHNHKVILGLAAAMLVSGIVVKAEDIFTAFATDTMVVVSQPEALRQRLTPTKPDTSERNAEPAKKKTETATKKKDEDKKKEETAAGRRRVTTQDGWRVQVFSDNNPRTAKNGARSKQRAVAGRFPSYRTYVSFTAPYWRTRVGDFKTQGEANAAASAIRGAFPGMEARVVRDKIYVF